MVNEHNEAFIVKTTPKNQTNELFSAIVAMAYRGTYRETEKKRLRGDRENRREEKLGSTDEKT